MKRLFRAFRGEIREIHWSKPSIVAKQTSFIMIMITIIGVIFMSYDLVIQKILSLIV